MHSDDPATTRLDERLIHHTRVHALRNQPSNSARIWIKREDETPFGTKQRKYASLLPNLRRQGIQAVAMLGSMASNHLVAAAQLLRQEGIQIRLVLREGHADDKAGNPLLLQLLTHPSKRWVVPRTQWHDAMQFATERMQAEFRNAPHMVLPEGAFHPFAVLGAMTLANDIRRNEEELDVKFDHIILDAGTGLTSAALLCNMEPSGLQGKLHVLVRAGSLEEMRNRFETVRSWCSELGIKRPPMDDKVQLHQPAKGRSFGAIHPSGLEFITDFARSEGILLDPLYNGPLLQHTLELVKEGHLQGDVLVLHGGGISAIHGFADRLTGR